MKCFLSVLVMLTVAGCSSGSDSPEPAPKAAEKVDTAPAVKAAETWMALVDKKEYATSWENAARMLQKVIAKEAWHTQLEKTLPLFGPLQSRTLKKAEYVTSLPGAPDGEYVRMEFTAVFEKKADATESITVVKEDDTWKVTGYYIK